MGRSVLTLALTAVIAVVLGALGTAAIAGVATTSSEEVAKSVTKADIEKPAGYGSK